MATDTKSAIPKTVEVALPDPSYTKSPFEEPSKADYDQAIEQMILARDSTPEQRVRGCATCGDDCNPHFCHHNPMHLARVGWQAKIGGWWKCYHCGEAFTSYESAASHFGSRESKVPTCVAKQVVQALPPAAQLEMLRELAKGLGVTTVPREPTEAMLVTGGVVLCSGKEKGCIPCGKGTRSYWCLHKSAARNNEASRVYRAMLKAQEGE